MHMHAMHAHHLGEHRRGEGALVVAQREREARGGGAVGLRAAPLAEEREERGGQVERALLAHHQLGLRELAEL